VDEQRPTEGEAGAAELAARAAVAVAAVRWPGAAAHDAVGQGVDQLVLVAEVPVDGGRVDTEPLAQGSSGERREAPLVDQGERLVQDAPVAEAARASRVVDDDAAYLADRIAHQQAAGPAEVGVVGQQPSQA